MQQRLTRLALILLVLGAGIFQLTGGFFVFFAAQAKAIELQQKALLEKEVPGGGRLVAEADGTVWVESRFRNRHGTGTQRSYVGELSYEYSQLQEKRARLETHLLLWRPLRWHGAIPVAIGLMLLAAAWLVGRRPQPRRPAEKAPTLDALSSESIVIVPRGRSLPNRKPLQFGTIGSAESGKPFVRS
jgi:hypothetical protein